MTIAHLKTWIKEKVVNAMIAFLAGVVIVCCVAFALYLVEQPVFFGISVVHLILTLIGGILLCIYLEVPIDFPGTVVVYLFWLPSLMLFHVSTYMILGLNMLGVIQVALNWKTWTLLATVSLIAAAAFGSVWEWLDRQRDK